MDLDLSNLEIAQTIKKAKEGLPAPVEISYKGVTEIRREVLTFMEVQFWMNGELPSEQSIIELFVTQEDRMQALSVLRDPDLNKVHLANRGLPEFNDRSARGFSPEAVIAANMITDIYDKRSIGAKLKSLNLNTRQWNGFLKDEDFKKYFTTLVEQRFDGDISTVAKINLGKLVENADLRAIQYFHELTGEYRPQNEEVQQLHLIIARMMEVLAKFVSPQILDQVATELETVIDVKELTQ